MIIPIYMFMKNYKSEKNQNFEKDSEYMKQKIKNRIKNGNYD